MEPPALLRQPRTLVHYIILLLPRHCLLSRGDFPTAPPPFEGVHVGFLSPFDCHGALKPSGEHAVQRKGKDGLVSLCCAGLGIHDSRRTRCGLLCDNGRSGSGNSFWKLHQGRFLPAGRGDALSETGVQDHMCCLANNQPCSSLIGSSACG